MKKSVLFSLLVCVLSIPLIAGAVSAEWWDKFGTPQYGGTITIREGDLGTIAFDPMEFIGTAYTTFWVESLFGPDWAVDRSKWAFNMGFTPIEYVKGMLAESWEWKNPQTLVVKLRQGVKWQDKPPVNGREFTAEDVQYSYDRLLGTGSGYSKPMPMWPMAALPLVQRVVATDKYTVEFRIKKQSAMAIYQITEAALMRSAPIIAKEWAELSEAGRKDWKNAVGTGPWLLTDFVINSSMTLSKNPNYFGHDERYPQNQLPYADTYKAVAITDMATSMAALRTGKVDLIVQTRGGMSWQQAKILAKSNPELIQQWIPNPGFALDMRCDNKPFTDIKVRTAMQMAVNTKAIAKSIYGGTVDGVTCGVNSQLSKGWVTPVSQWPQDIKDGYGFNPANAKKLLAEAGYPKGFKTNCIASTNDDLNLLQVIKGMFKNIGIDMDIKSMDPTTFQSFVTAGKHNQLVMTNGTAMPFGPDWCIRFRGSTNTRDNFTRNNDPKYDDIIKQYDAAQTFEEAQKKSIEADLYLLRQHWAVQICPTAIPFVWQPYLKGYSGEIIIGSQWHAFVPSRLWIDQKMKKKD